MIPEDYTRHLLSDEDDLGGFYVDVFECGDIHIFDRTPPTEEQVSLSSDEVEKLFAILYEAKEKKEGTK